MEIREGFVICSKHEKLEIMKEATDFKNYIFLTEGELEKKVYGECKPEALYEIMNKYSISYDLANTYIKYLPFVEGDLYNNIKLDSLVSVRSFLISKGLFSKDEFFLYRLKQFPVTFISSDQSIRHKHLVDVISKITEVIELEKSNTKYTPEVLSYNEIQDEVLGVCNKCVDLINEGVNPSDIYIINMDSDYEYLFRRAISNYNLPIVLPKSGNISYYPVARRVIKLCSEKNTFDEILNEISPTNEYYSVIFNLIDRYNLVDKNPLEYKDFLTHLLMDSSEISIHYDNEINTQALDIYPDNAHVFYLGLNLGTIPRVYKDDEYLNDNELALINNPGSIEKNRISKANLINILTTTKNIYLSYKNSVNGEKTLPSNIIKELKLNVRKVDVAYGYSENEDYLRLGVLYSKKLKYKTNNEALDLYDISKLSYNSYDNKFTGIDKTLLDEKFAKKKLSLAYSSVKNYFACPFYYYADRILGLNEFKPNMAARLGTYSHAVLEDSYKEGFSFEESVLKNKTENATDYKDSFYFDVMKGVLSELITFNKEHEGVARLDKVMMEAHAKISEDTFDFEGYVDKVLYTEINNEIYLAIIDYKTGKDIVSLNNVEDGFNLQLPSYMYLLSHYEPFAGKKLHILGIYLQKVNIIALDNTCDIAKQRADAFKLQGYTIADKSLISMLDPLYFNSDYINGMRVKADGGFYSYTKVINEDEENELINLVDRLIHGAAKDIHDGKFEIAPKMIDGVNKSCTFCKYKDICNMKYNDLVMLDKKEFGKKED